MYEKEVEVALKLTRRAGTIALRYYQRHSRVQLKEGRSPVTAADQKIELLLTEQLARLFPHDRIVGEEHGFHQGHPGRFWLIDPIDGTRMFIHKTGHFSTMIALVDHGLPVVGVIHAPVRQKTFFAIRGHGSYVQRGSRRRKLRVRHDIGWLRQSTLCVTHPRLQRSTVHTLSHEIRQHLGAKNALVTGSAGFDFCAVAEGRATVSVMANPRIAIWDTAAGQVIVEEAGGVVSDLSGQPLQYRWGNAAVRLGTVATTPSLRAEVLSALKAMKAGEKFHRLKRRLLHRT